MFNHKDLKWNKNIFNYFSRRAEIVDLYNNKNNIMKFDNIKFLNSVKNIMDKNYRKNNYKMKL